MLETMKRAALAVLAMTSGAATAQPAMSPPAGEVLATVAGDRIENVIQGSDGALYFTAVFGGKVMRRAPDGTIGTFVALHSCQGVLETNNGFLIDYQLRDPDFAGGKMSFKGLGAQLAVLDKQGKVLRTLSGPDDAAFYNGMGLAGRDTLYIADTGGDRILKADLRAGTVAVWYTPPPRTGPVGPGPSGPNGLKVHDGWVYFARGDVYRVKIGAGGKAAGEAVLAATTGGTDDFDVAVDGTIYASAHGADVVRASPRGETTVFVKGGCPFCTATRVSKDGRSLYLTGGGIPRPNMPAVAGYVSRVPLQ